MNRRCGIIHHRSGAVTLDELRDRIDVLEAENEAKGLRIHELRVVIGAACGQIKALDSREGALALAAGIRAECERLGVADGPFPADTEAKA